MVSLALHDVALKDSVASTGLIERSEGDRVTELLLIVVDVVAANDPVLTSCIMRVRREGGEEENRMETTERSRSMFGTAACHPTQAFDPARKRKN